MFCPYCGSELKEDHAFCMTCGKKIEQAKKIGPSPVEASSAAVVGPAPPIETPPPAPVTSAPTVAKPMLSRRAMGLLLVAIIAGGFIVFPSTVKCIPTIRSYTADEKYQQTEWTPVKEVVFQDTFYLDQMTTYGSGWRKDSKRFWLDKHWEVLIEAAYSNAYGWATLYDSSDRNIGSNKGTYVTPNSGQYYVTFSNFGTSTGCTVSVKIIVTAKLQTVEKTITITKYEIAYLTVFEWLTKKS